MTDWNNLKPPVDSADWQTNPPLPPSDAVAPVDGWGAAPKLTKSVWDAFDYGRFAGLTGQAAVDAGKFDEEDSAWSRGDGLNQQKQLTEAIWTATVLNSSNTRASVVNSLAGTKDAFNIDQDGELTRMKEITNGVGREAVGYYIAYSNGKWLHAILSGPYSNEFALDAWGDAAYDLMTNDAAFKLAFGNEFNRDGIYLAQIPLSAKRHGAYGVLS